jgi:DNA-binding NarL/FixJ family response regulator
VTERAANVVRVVVADDHPMVRYGIAAVLADDAEVQLAGEATDGATLLDLVDREHPDVVLTDLAMPGLGGLDAIHRLRRLHPAVRILVLTMHTDDESVYAALRAGAHGYLVKGADRAELIRAILAVASGDAVYGSAVANRITAFFTGGHDAYPAKAFPDLTERERQVLDLIAGGARNSQIAAQLGLSDKTIRNHVSAILVKLHVPDRTAAALRAREAGLGRAAQLSPPATEIGQA